MLLQFYDNHGLSHKNCLVTKVVLWPQGKKNPSICYLVVVSVFHLICVCLHPFINIKQRISLMSSVIHLTSNIFFSFEEKKNRKCNKYYRVHWTIPFYFLVRSDITNFKDIFGYLIISRLIIIMSFEQSKPLQYSGQHKISNRYKSIILHLFFSLPPNNDYKPQ